ncbi:unnamed protein product [Adineta steineri]|uniref:Uncharacterized protein n=1 Tax=Adineta steineri TaxID=433720 RepID=A0A819B398_9BILA|nr:unnamed protein product [Adineta steineri]
MSGFRVSSSLPQPPTATSVATATSVGAGKARPVGKATSVGTREARPVGKATSVGAGNARPVGKAASVGARNARPVGKAASVGARNARPAGKATSVGARDARPVGKAASVETQEFAAPGTCEELFCSGRPCAKCHNCSDWHFTGDQTTWQWVCNYKSWKEADVKLWHDGRYKLFTKRDGRYKLFTRRDGRYKLFTKLDNAACLFDVDDLGDRPSLGDSLRRGFDRFRGNDLPSDLARKLRLAFDIRILSHGLGHLCLCERH